MKASNQFPVLICGAGPTGLSLAIELARRDVPVEIIDKKKSISPFSKALGIQARTLEYFAMMGCADAFLTEGRKLDTFNVNLDGFELRASFQELKTPFPYVLILGQNDTEKILTDHLNQLGIDVALNTELIGLETSTSNQGNTTALLRSVNSETSKQYSYVVGCDGPHSFVRGHMGIAFEGRTYEEEFLLVDGVAKNAPEQWQLVLKEKHINLMIPMKTVMRAVVNVPHEDLNTQVGAHANENETGIVNDLYRYQDNCGGRTEFSRVDWASRFRIHRRLAAQYRQGRLLLAGDSAHVHSPAGGQGMNTGIGDAMNLGWKLAGVLKYGLSETLLNSYEKERRPVAESVLSSTDIFTRISTSDGVWGLARNIAGPFLKYLGGLGPRIGNRISQLDISYPTPGIGHRFGFGGNLFRPGNRFYLEIENDSGNPVSPHSLLDGRWLILYSSSKDLTLSDKLDEQFKLVKMLVAGTKAKTDEQTLYTKEKLPLDKLYLVRPDGFISAIKSIPANRILSETFLTT